LVLRGCAATSFPRLSVCPNEVVRARDEPRREDVVGHSIVNKTACLLYARHQRTQTGFSAPSYLTITAVGGGRRRWAGVPSPTCKRQIVV